MIGFKSMQSFFFSCVVALLVVLVVLIVLGDNGLLDLRTRRQEMARLQSVNANRINDIMALHRENTRLKDDSEYVEQVVRHELNVVGTDEMVVLTRAPEILTGAGERLTE